jgi:hypothetical protein
VPVIDRQGAKFYYQETGSGTPVVWIQGFATVYRPWEARFVGRNAQIEPVGRTPMSVRYTSRPAVRNARIALKNSA